MKIALSQQNYHIGNFELNVQKIIRDIHSAEAQGADLIVFSELCVCGYPPRDFLEFSDFVEQSLSAIECIKKETKNIGVIVGAPSRNPKIEGKDLFNSAYFLYQGQQIGIAHKTLLPTYDIFDEYRQFEPAYTWNTIVFKGKKIALTICEDIWNYGDNPLYPICPMDQLMKEQPDIMINISASPFDYHHSEGRQYVVNANIEQYKIPMIYCNTVGSQTEVVFDGGSLVVDAKKRLVKQMSTFAEDFAIVDWKDDGSFDQYEDSAAFFEPEDNEIPEVYQPERGIEQIHSALIMGIRDYFSKQNFGKAIVASSGGVDSALTLALACEALGSENVHALLMPSQYSSSHSIDDAVQLSNNLNNRYDIISIESIFNSFTKELHPLFSQLPQNVTEENIQARTRGTLVMALANKFNYILLNTSNKSELATGYGTLYGDMAGGLSVIGDLYKNQVYALSRYLNREREIIPNHILEKAPSAELRPGQKDSDSLPDYSILDAIL